MAVDGPEALEESGIVVLAHGAARFHDQAADLARSLRLHSPGQQVALLTDRPDEFRRGTLFDHVVLLPGAASSDCRAKLDLNLYTPFRRTLYLDSDSLAFRDLGFVFHRHRGRDVVVLGRPIREGHWYGDVRSLCRLARALSIPQFNGGVIYLEDTAVAHAVFRRARELVEHYDELSLDRFCGGVADEPLLALALAERGIDPDPRDADTSVSLLGLQGRPELDVVSGRASFVKNGRAVSPAVVHFAGEYAEPASPEGVHYKKARAVLKEAIRNPRPGIPDRRPSSPVD